MGPWRILVVDDEVEIREVLTEFLEGLGHSVDALASGKQAIERLSTLSEPYDLAVVDWTMPGITGRDLVYEIQRRSPRTVIVVATGRLDLTPLPGLEPLAVPILRKPFQLRALQSALIAAMERAGRSAHDA